MARSRNQGNPPGPEGEIVLVPNHVCLRGSKDATILEVLHESNVPIASTCGGLGSCGKCKIRFAGTPPDPSGLDLEHFDSEEISRGWRLACQRAVGDQVAITLYSESGELDHKAQNADCPEARSPNPAIRLHTCVLAPTCSEDSRPLADQLRDALGQNLLCWDRPP